MTEILGKLEKALVMVVPFEEQLLLILHFAGTAGAAHRIGGTLNGGWGRGGLNAARGYDGGAALDDSRMCFGRAGRAGAIVAISRRGRVACHALRHGGRGGGGGRVVLGAVVSVGAHL